VGLAGKQLPPKTRGERAIHAGARKKTEKERIQTGKSRIGL